MKSFSFSGFFLLAKNKQTKLRNRKKPRYILWKFTFPLLFSNLIMILLFQLKCLLVVNKNFPHFFHYCMHNQGNLKQGKAKSVSKWKTDEKFIVFLWGAWMANYGNEYFVWFSTKENVCCCFWKEFIKM